MLRKEGPNQKGRRGREGGKRNFSELTDLIVGRIEAESSKLP